MFKTDDDSYVNMPALVSRVRHHWKDAAKMYLGRVCTAPLGAVPHLSYRISVIEGRCLPPHTNW